MIGRNAQAIGLLLFPLLAIGAFEAIQGWRSARTEQAIARGAARPVPVLPGEGVAIVAADRTGAERNLIAKLGDRASALGVRLASGLATADKDGHVIAADIVAQGSDEAVEKFATAIETGKPTARLERWTLTPAADGLRLEGRAIAFWRTAQALPAAGPDAITVPQPVAAPPVPPAHLFAPAADVRAHAGFPAELIGIVGRIAVDPQAMLRLADGKTRTLAVGETIEGWTLAAIDADRVRFTRGGQDKTLVLPTASE